MTGVGSEKIHSARRMQQGIEIQLKPAEQKRFIVKPAR